MMSFTFDPFPVLKTERLVLRRPGMQDVDELYRYRSDVEYMHFIPHRLVSDKSEVVSTIERIDGLIDRCEGINWAITMKENDSIMGMLGYVRFNKDHYRAEIGYSLHTPYQNMGIVHEAMKAVMQYGFETLKLHSIEAIINTENLPSKKVVERLGFSNDAFFKDYLLMAGKFVDANVYSLVKTAR